MPIKFSNSTSTWIKVALVTLTIGCVLFVIGFSTISWIEGSSVDRYSRQMMVIEQGLWKIKFCMGSKCTTTSFTHETDWLKATQAMETLGLIGILVALLILLLHIFVDKCKGRNTIISIIVFLFAGVACITIGIIIYSTKGTSETVMSIGWSMGLAIAGAIFSFIAGITVVLGLLGK